METNTSILDASEIASGKSIKAYIAPWNTRFANFFLDMVFHTIFTVIFTVFFSFLLEAAALFGLDGASDFFFTLLEVLFWLSFLFYYILFEYYFGKTPGKFLTKTRVLTKTGEKPGFWQIVGRTLCRYIPFEPFSYLFSRVGWHDSISNTLVVEDGYLGEEGPLI